MNNPIHIQVKIVEFLSIGIGQSSVDRYFVALDFRGLFFDDWRNDFGILLRQPPEKRWNAHDCKEANILEL